MKNCQLNSLARLGRDHVVIDSEVLWRVTPVGAGNLETAFSEMVETLGLPCRPRLVFVDDLQGRGGLYTAGLVVVGRQDAWRIASAIWRRSAPQVVHRVRTLRGKRWLSRDDCFDFFTVFVLGRIVAHELGHAAEHLLGVSSPRADPEEAADFMAGFLDVLRARDDVLGELVFQEIGCIGPSCTHPSPGERARAYRAGRREGGRRLRPPRPRYVRSV